MNDRKIARVAKAICDAAGKENRSDGVCVTCEQGVCMMWQSFVKEAIAALKASKGF